MLRIDGSKGEGGGQVLRTCLTLSLATGQPFTLEKIRAKRNKPGLMRQHLTCVQAARDICQGYVSGDELGSNQITFHPDEIQSGHFSFAIGTAGGTGLVFQTLFPALLMTDEPSSLEISGGTHAPSAPPYEFIRDGYLNTLSKIGIECGIELNGAGFYPAGGGKISAQIKPASLDQKLDLTSRGQLKAIHGEARVSNLPGKIAVREVKTLIENLNLEEGTFKVREVDSPGPGNVILAWLEFDQHTEVYSGFGQHGVLAEKIADRVAKAINRHNQSEAVIGPHLADQLLLPMALGAGGRFTMMRPSQHFETNVETIQRFLDISIRYKEEDEKLWLVEVG